MIDLHCHIVPGIDDGSKDLAMAIEMAEVAVSQGITHILCTPHHNNGKYENQALKVIKAVETLQQVLDARGIPLTLLEGQEVRIGGNLMEEISNQNILFADLNNRYILIEFPTNDIPSYSERLFAELMMHNHIPIIVHPERNRKFIEDPNRLIPFLDMGILTQLTAPSYMGIFGKKIQRVAKEMVNHQLVYMLASDAHNLQQREFLMKQVYKELAQDVGKEQVQAMQQMARDILNGDDVTIPEYQEVKRKKFIVF